MALICDPKIFERYLAQGKGLEFLGEPIAELSKEELIFAIALSREGIHHCTLFKPLNNLKPSISTPVTPL